MDTCIDNYDYYRLKAHNYCMDFLGRKINLSRKSSAKRSRSGPNSVYVDMSRGDNINNGHDRPIIGKMGAGTITQSASFFCVVNQTTFRQLYGRFLPNLVSRKVLELESLILKYQYPLWVQKLLCYTIQHEGTRHIDFRQMSVSPGQTTANDCKTAFHLHVFESASDDYSF